MPLKSLIIMMLISTGALANVTRKYTPQEYVESWKKVAIEQMNLHRIPASITMAQAILESGNGNSDLAQLANNHFGIKCHNWTGETFYKDDDQKNECFRKYTSADESFVDHSLFLKGKTRYAALFDLELTDYKGWAQGLKDAGYATNPKYPEMLIELIERMNLAQLDQDLQAASAVAAKVSDNKKDGAKTVELRMANTHVAQVHANRVKYIVAKKGDTFYRIAKEYKLGMWELYRYNDFDSKKDVLIEGDIVYIEPKKRKSNVKPVLTLARNMTAMEISQQEGVKLRRVMKLNHISSPDLVIQKGEKIALK